MNLSKKSRYGITALIDLAVYAKDQCVQLSSIAERNNISVKYLRKAGLVRSVKGPQGGYLLAKRPESITVADVIHALDGSYLLEDERSVVSGTDEKGISTAIQKLLIDQMNDQTDRLLKQLTLRNLVDSSMEYSQVGHEMYYI
jgi:Rrf2 family protein